MPSQVDSAFETPITREDFCSLAAAVYRAWDRENVLQTASTGKVSFTDTDNADVLLCASAGVVNGVGNGKFAPDKNITRQEAASMLHRLGALNKNVKNDVNDRLPHVFADGEKIRSWARSDINWVYRQGIMNGTGAISSLRTVRIRASSPSRPRSACTTAGTPSHRRRKRRIMCSCRTKEP